MRNDKPKNILVAPMDWGLGHTTRCIPLIRHIHYLGHVPVFAGNTSQCAFIDEIFSGIKKVHLEGYNITYSAWNRFLQIGLLSQMPQLLKTIKREHHWLENACKEHYIDGVISDNRYGLYTSSVPCTIMTHQIVVRTGVGSMADKVMQGIHYKLLNRFNNVWMPDMEGEVNLAGELSHSKVLPVHCRYIGLLSQFEENIGNGACGQNLLILLSGPEPVRTILSRMLWSQALMLNQRVIFVEGSEYAATPEYVPEHVQYYKRVSSKTLLLLLQQARTVICRSGYSTLMDLTALKKNAILIPTPGQTEQQYLAKHLQEKGMFVCAAQSNLDLDSLLQCYNGIRVSRQMICADAFGLYKPILEEWLKHL